MLALNNNNNLGHKILVIVTYETQRDSQLSIHAGTGGKSFHSHPHVSLFLSSWHLWV